jgi:hypothetical protein
MEPLTDRSAPYLVEGHVQAITVQRGVRRDGRAWTRYGVKVQGAWHDTFNDDHAALARRARDEDVPVVLEYAPTQYGRDVLQIVIKPEEDYRP